MPDSTDRLRFQPINGHPNGLSFYKKHTSGKKLKRNIIIAVVAVLLLVVGAITYYNIQLAPVGGSTSDLKKVVIAKGSTPNQIGKQLQDMSIIRSSLAFDIYTRLNGTNNTLKAGNYRLSPAESLPQIVKHLTNGSVDQFSVTFYPGATLVDKTDKPDSKKYDITTQLTRAGYSTEEIATALNRTYDSPLFKDKPATADLEGYVYGETYNFNTGATVEDILQATFDQFYKVIQDNKLAESFSDHGLNLYQGITLASIVQREANRPQDQKQVAQVFYLRLDQGMVLGSDVTYQYIADKTGVARDTNLDSPYNTRRFAGLTPGPIAVPGLSALKAVASPASGDYVYFLAGDDGIVYFAHTLAEHEANITNYCKVGCSTP